MRQARPLKSASVAASRPARDRLLALMREQLEAIRAHESGTRAGTDPEQLHRMRTEGGHRRQHFGRMMDLVELPQHRHVVQQAMRREAAEVVGEEEGEGE